MPSRFAAGPFRRTAHGLMPASLALGVILLAQAPGACAPETLLAPEDPASVGGVTAIESSRVLTPDELNEFIATSEDQRIVLVFVNPAPLANPNDENPPIEGPVGPPAIVVGEVRMWAGPPDTSPLGWLPCDGREVDRVAHAPLYSVIRDAYGAGDGATTFNLPDFRNRSPMGADSINAAHLPQTSVSGKPAGFGGQAEHVLTLSELPIHSHSIAHEHDLVATEHGSLGASAVQLVGPLEPPTTFPTGSPSQSESGFAGGDQPHNNLHPYFAISYIIYSGAELNPN